MLYMLYSIYLSSFFFAILFIKNHQSFTQKFLCAAADRALRVARVLREFCSRNLSLATLDARGEKG